MADAIAPRGKAQRALGRNVDRVRIGRFDDARHAVGGKKRQPDFFICWHRHSDEEIGRHGNDFVSEPRQL